MSGKGLRLVSILCVLTCLAQGCARTRVPDRTTPASTKHDVDRACRRHSVRVEGPYHQELAEPVENPALDAIPAEARRTARAAGLEPLILAFLQARGASAEVQRLSLRQTLWMRLDALETQLQSLLSEVECTDDVVEDLRDVLEDREHARELKLTLASLVLGAVAATAAGALELRPHGSEASALTGIAGGVGSAALGLAALIPRRHTTPYTHAHNLLAPIASGADPERLYPTFVRRLLEVPPAAGAKSPRAELLAQFEVSLAARYAGTEKEAARRLLFGAGGVYDHRLIDLREGMYDALESKLSTFARDLELLSRYLINLVEAPSPAEPRAGAPLQEGAPPKAGP